MSDVWMQYIEVASSFQQQLSSALRSTTSPSLPFKQMSSKDQLIRLTHYEHNIISLKLPGWIRI